ncbi:MAG: protein phosphatase 2C domain-containing protein [Micrococcales bacterium]|nr:protein phosphatase 2C domain-containing protein [Micrococcales bacterium]
MSEQTAVVAGVELAWASASDPGRLRPVNEDAVVAAVPVFVVADGMGGYEAGDRASAAVVESFRRRMVGQHLATLDAVRAALSDADEAVHQVGASTRRGAGSTVTGAVLVEHLGIPHWLVFNVGDSRVYRHVGGTLEQVTVDHSLVQAMLDAKELTDADVPGFQGSNVITRAIGSADATADSWLMPVVDGERLLMCTDGLHRELADESIRAALTMSGRPSSAADALVALANQAGGRDNITVVVVDVRSGGLVAGGDGDVTGSATLTRVSIEDTNEKTVEVAR